MNEPEKVHKTQGKPVNKGQAEGWKYKKIMNADLKQRDEEVSKEKKWPTDSNIPLEVMYDGD